MTFQDFVTVLARRWWVLVVGAAVGIGIGLTFASTRSTVVEAEGRLLIGPALDEGLDLNDSTSGLSRGTLQQTLAELATGSQVVEASRAEVQNTSTAFVIKSIVIPETNVVRVTVEGPTAGGVTELASATMNQVETSFEVLYPIYDVTAIDDPLTARQIAPNPQLGALFGLVIGLMAATLAVIIEDWVRRAAPDRTERHLRAPDLELDTAPDLGRDSTVREPTPTPLLPERRVAEPTTEIPSPDPEPSAEPDPRTTRVDQPASPQPSTGPEVAEMWSPGDPWVTTAQHIREEHDEAEHTG